LSRSILLHLSHMERLKDDIVWLRYEVAKETKG
jgi:hypothetical protein